MLRFDPDVFVGHGFAADLDVLLNRLKECQVDHWSRIGRMRRPKWPKLVQRELQNLLTGRLVVDLFSDGMKVRCLGAHYSQSSACVLTSDTGIHRLGHVESRRDVFDAPKGRTRIDRPRGNAQVL